MATTELMRKEWRGGEDTRDAEWDFGAWTNPFTAAPLVFITGVVLYMLGVEWWWPTLAGVAFGLSFFGAARARRLRRLATVYTLASAGIATGWLVYASTVLTFDVRNWPGTLTNVIAGAVITLPMAVIWGLLVRGAARARVAEYMAAQGQVATRNGWEVTTTDAGIKGWSTVDTDRSEDATTVTMRINPGGTTYREALARIEALEVAANAAFPGAIRIEQPKGAGVSTVIIRQAHKSAFDEPIPMPPVPTEPRSILDPITDGQYEDGEPCSRNHAYQSVATLGQRESGKSGLQNVRIDAYGQCEDCLLFGIDFKEGRWLRPWLAAYATGQAERPVFDWVGTSAASVSKMLDALIAIGKSRAATTNGDKITPGRHMPAIRLMIDEIADLLANPANQAVAAKLVLVVRKLRSEGIDIDIASQRGTMSFLGNVARDLLSQTTVLDLLKVDSAAEIFNSLSMPMSKLGSVDPTTFDEPGVKITLGRGVRVAASRAFDLDPNAIPARASIYSKWRPALEPAAATAAGRAYAERWNSPEALQLLAASAASVGATEAAERWTRQIRTAKTSVAEAPSATPPEPSSLTPGGLTTSSLRDQLIAQHGAEQGEALWQTARGRAVLIAAKPIIGTRDYILTRELLDGLAAADPTRWADLDARGLATLVAHHSVEPRPIRSENNARGYFRSDIEAAF